jgi:hypothetical protein
MLTSNNGVQGVRVSRGNKGISPDRGERLECHVFEPGERHRTPTHVMPLAGRVQQIQISDGAPDCIQIHFIVTMAQVIPESATRFPRNLGLV